VIYKKLALTLLALSCVAPGIHAETAPVPVQTIAHAVDPAAIQALKEMGAYLQTLKRFTVSTELTGERVLADGQKLQHTASATLNVERPDKLHASMTSARSARVLYYDGKAVTLYTPAQKYYSTVSFSGNLADLVNRLEEHYAVEIPLSDLFLWGTPAAPVDALDSAMNAGQDLIDGALYDHFAFRQGDVDWQIWIAAGAKPLPRKLVITNRADEARPQSVSLIEWNLSPGFSGSVFNFMPPKGATAVKLHSLANK
jgi:hypothetical protein